MRVERFFGALIVGAAAAGAAFAQGDLPQFPLQLEEMMVSANGADFIVPGSIEREGDIARVWVLAVTPREITATAYFWSHERIDCSARTIEKLNEAHFTESYVEFHRRTAEPVAVPERAQANVRVDRVCGGATDPVMTKSYSHVSDVLFATWPRIDEAYRQATGEEPG